MKTVSGFFDTPWAYQRDRENFEKYGTCDLDEIDLIEAFAKNNVEKRASEIGDERAEHRFNEIKDKFELDVIKETNETFIIKKGEEISISSPFVSDFVDVNGQRLYRQDFIPDTFRRDPLYFERRLDLNLYNGHWQKTYKTKGPEFVSNVQVVGGYIVNPRAKNKCESIEVYIKGRDTPLHFKDGNFSTRNIVKELQLEDTSLDKEWVAEAFKRSLIMCPNIEFLTVPEHVGGNRLPNGTLTYVSASSVIPGLEEQFPIAINEHKLAQHERSFDEVVNDYKLTLPQNWKAKVAVVDRVTSTLLPFYEEEGLRPDHVKVISYEEESVKHGFIALSKRMNYESTVVKSLSDRSIDVKKDLAMANDITVLYTYSSTIESRGICDNRFTDIRLDLQGENGIENPTRKQITILTETPGSVPENLPAYFLSIDENIEFGDIVKLQQLTGEFDFSLINFLYNNQDAARLIIHSAFEKARSNVKLIRNAEITQSMIMFLATAHILKKIELISESELAFMIRWFSKKATSRTTVSDRLSYDIGAAVSRAICSGELRITNQFEPPYYRNDGKTAFIAEVDGSINVEAETFEKVFLTKIKSTERRNLVLRALVEKRYLIPTKDHKRDLKVRFENGYELSIRVYSLSNALLNDEAKEIVEKALISDTFHKLDKMPVVFYPFIKHKNFDLVAGQVIRNYSSINPFVCVTGSPASGKTDFLHTQAIQRAVAGDTVIILDQTNSSCYDELKSHKIQEDVIGERVLFWDMSVYGWPIELMGFSGCESDEQKIQRLSSWLKSGSHLTGSNQFSILQNMVEKMVCEYGKSHYSIKKLIDMLLKDTGKEGEVKNRLMSLFGTVANCTSIPPGWEEFMEVETNTPSWEKMLSLRGKVIVISTGNAVTKADCNPLDIVLDSFYGFKDKHRDGNVTLIFDEIQRMNLEESAPLDVILSTGRKLNVSAFIATQRFAVGKGKIARIEEYCDTKVFFKPMDSCIKAVSAKTKMDVDTLWNFEQGECAIIGSIFSENCGKNIPIKSAILGKTYRPPYVGSYN